MLTAKQIKTMAKMYTDAAMVRKNYSVYTAESPLACWSNGYVVFFEPLPAKHVNGGKQDVKPLPVDNLLEIVNTDRVQVWPVGVRPYFCCKKRVVVRFADGNGTETWIDGKYVSAVLVRRRAGKGGVRWYYSPKGKDIVAVNERPVAVIAETHVEGKMNEPEWSLRNLDLPDDGEPWQEIRIGEL